MRKCWMHNSRVDQAVVPVGDGRARPRCWSAAAGPGCGARGRRQGLAGLFTATRHHWCGGRRRDRRVRAGFEARRRTK